MSPAAACTAWTSTLSSTTCRASCAAWRITSRPESRRAHRCRCAQPALKQYSKAPEHAFDAQLRRRLLADAEAQFGEEIRAGLRWCETSGAQFARVARALDYFGGSAAR
jgi:hypothetical protein